MTLAIFDLDNTLLAGDSDYLWGRFLVEKGIVDAKQHERENERFFAEYRTGKLDIYEFLRFSLKPLSQHPAHTLLHWRSEFIEKKILPIITNKALELVNKHRQAGDILLMVTATNSFVTAPIAKQFDIEHLIATEPEMRNGHYTGEVAGEPSFREGKVKRLNIWLEEFQHSLEGSWFYSDSHNDLPLLEQVANPVAVDPDQALAKVARTRHWPILQLHTQ
jgi:HAD superfamily hydrolase (TIGR01490 family)